MSTKGYSAPLTWARLLELAAQGHDHYDTLTSTRARQLVASVREHFASQPEAPKGPAAEAETERADFFHAESKRHLDQIFELCQELSAANARADQYHRLSVSQGAELDRANAKIEELTIDRDEWLTQHENLLAIYQASVAEVAAANARADAAEREADDVTKLVKHTRELHNICDRSLVAAWAERDQLAARVTELEAQLNSKIDFTNFGSAY